MNLSNAVEAICSELKNDSQYREAWKSNIAIAFKDCHSQYKTIVAKQKLSNEDIHIIANSSAEFFIRLLTDDKEKSNQQADGMVAYSLDLIDIIKEHQDKQ